MFRDCRGGRGVSICDQKVGSKPNRSLRPLWGRIADLAILRRLRPISAHGRHSARSRGFSKPDVRSKTPTTASYGLRWFEGEPTDDGNAPILVVPRSFVAS